MRDASPYSWRLVAQALAGMQIGVILAAVAARVLFPPDGPASSVPSTLLTWVLPIVRSEPRQKALYVFALAFGGLGAFLATGRVVQGRRLPLGLWAAIGLSVPLVNALIGRTLQDSLSPTVGLLVALGAVGILGYLLRCRATKIADTREGGADPADQPRCRRWPYYPLLLGLTLVLIPSSFAAVAAAIDANVEAAMHVVSFLIGPALYFLGSHLVPGIDYYAQYGVGMGWLFSRMLGTSPIEALTHYVVFLTVTMWLFYAHLLYLLHWLYRSWIAAATITFLSLLLLFVTSIHFFAPSSTVLRYPLLTLCAILLGRWTAQPANSLRLLVLASSIACAVFVDTETGIETAVAIAVADLCVVPWRADALARLLALGLASALILLLLFTATIGPIALTPPFFGYLLEPLTIYGVAGMGALEVAWTLRSWNWLYNLVAPGMAIATLAVIARAGRVAGGDKGRSAVLAFFAVSGLLMLSKFANQALIAVWRENAVGLLVVLGWWGVLLARRVKAADFAILPPWAGVPLGRFAVAGMLACAVGLAGFGGDPRNPTAYGLESWLAYPSLLRTSVLKLLDIPAPVSADPRPFHFPSRTPVRPAQSDLSLILGRTRPREQVAIVSDINDWRYLIVTRRPPLMAFLPSEVIFTRRQLVESVQRLSRARYVFVPKGPDGLARISNPDLRRDVLPLLETVFVRDGEGERFIAFKRKLSGDLPSRRSRKRHAIESRRD